MIVGIGQMFVITLGPGNVDLSIPATMTLAGTRGAQGDGRRGRGPSSLGLAVALGVGLGVGLVNYALIKALRIPPIIATLSTSFIVQSTAIWTNRGLRIKPPDSLAAFSTGSTFGVPNLAWIALALALARLGAARAQPLRPHGLGDRPEPARRAAGRRAGRRRAAAPPTCSARCWRRCAASCSSCFSGGAALNMGAEYLLMSIAVVVIGGSSVAGGNSNVPGIWGAALFMFLVVSMLNTYGFGAGRAADPDRRDHHGGDPRRGRAARAAGLGRVGITRRPGHCAIDKPARVCAICRWQPGRA